jgi:hypothetical protein
MPNNANISQTGGLLSVLISTLWNKPNWEIIPKTNVPAGISIIGARWVLARKDDGLYQARRVAKGFSQIPGNNFQENHAPVISDTTLFLLLVVTTVLQLEARHFDMEAAFLYGILEEDLRMVLPDGFIRIM